MKIDFLGSASFKKNILLIGSLFLVLFCINNSYADSTKKKQFVVVPKFVHPFFERINQGCQKAAEQLGVVCRYEPPQAFDESEQAKVVSDLLTQDIDGIAVAPISSAAIARVIAQANTKGIPVVTFDSDFKSEQHFNRKTYIGSENRQIGIELGKMLMKLKPEGGTIAIQAGEPPAENLKERLEGLRSILTPGKWREVGGSPLYCNADSQVAIQQLEDLLNSTPDLTAFVALGAWPQVAKQGYQQVVEQHIERIRSKKLVILVADTLKMQLELLKGGYCHGLVGQRPVEMGYQAVKVLNEITNGGVPSDPMYTGLDICYQENVDSCVSGS